jgi:hypothetical protein
MNLSISSDKAFHDSTIAFVRAIGGPKIEHFLARSYGSPVNMVAITLEIQNPKRTLRHHTRFFEEQRCLYYHVVLADELELGDRRSIFEAIATTMQSVLKKSFRKFKVEGFDCIAFEADLMAYIHESIVRSTSHESVA